MLASFKKCTSGSGGYLSLCMDKLSGSVCISVCVCVCLIIWVTPFLFFLWLLEIDSRSVCMRGQVCGYSVVIVLQSIVWTCVGVCMEVLVRVLMGCLWSVWVSLWFWDGFVLFDIQHGNCFHVNKNTSLTPLQTPKQYWQRHESNTSAPLLP